MRRSRRHLLSLLAVLLLVQWAAALQPCLRTLAGLASAQATVLCSASGGYETVLLDPDGEPAQPAKPHPGCPVCPHATPALLPEPAVRPAQPLAFVAVVQPLARPGLPPAPPRGPPQQPRAPPFA